MRRRSDPAADRAEAAAISQDLMGLHRRAAAAAAGHDALAYLISMAVLEANAQAGHSWPHGGAQQ
jgi:hypothetical protein